MAAALIMTHYAQPMSQFLTHLYPFLIFQRSQLFPRFVDKRLCKAAKDNVVEAV